MELVGYYTREKLIWKPGEGIRITNEVTKQVIPKTNTNKIYTTSTLGFGCYHHK